MLRSGLLLLSALALSTAARAADLDPPVYADAAPEYVPVEVGSGWYLRGDLGYQFDNGYGEIGSGHVFDVDADDPYLTGSVGVGYHFTDYLRADLNFGYAPGTDTDVGYHSDALDIDGTFSNDAFYGMANAYVDLGTVAGLTPYLGAGVGVLSNKTDWHLSYDFDDGTDYRIGEDNRDYTFAYALNAGLAYRIATNFSLDLGYQFLSSPDAKSIEGDSPENRKEKEGVDLHQVRLGLRYDLW